MNLTMHTYGYLDALYNTLQALAMFRNAAFYTELVQSVCFISGCYYAVKIASSTSAGDFKSNAYKILGMTILINALLLPTAPMIIKDHVTKRIVKVDNIPVAFAFPIGVMEEFGYIITRGFEQVFRPFSGDKGFDYFNYGLLFGQRLKQDIKNIRIKDPEFVSNMRNFRKRCIILPAMIGYQFTKEQLAETKDIWGLVSTKAGYLTRVDIYLGANRTSMSCKEAVDYFERNAWPKEKNRIFDKFSNTDFARANSGETYRNTSNNGHSSLNTFFENNVRKAYGNNSASKAIEQQMMINSLSDYRSSDYGVARARMQQESSSLLSSDMASIYLPMMLVVFKCIVYGSFIFLVPMLILSGGLRKYKSYLIVVVSLQLWPALNAILNMIIETYSNLSQGSTMLLSYSTASTIYNRVDSIVSVAAGLQMIIPFLAMWLTNLGAGGIMHLAGNIVGGMQSISGTIGSELATNNRSLDNLNVGNQQRNMVSSNKYDQTMSYFAGVNHGMYGDGTMETITASGQQIFGGGAGVTSSVGHRKLQEDNSVLEQISQGTQVADSLLSADKRSYSNAKSNTITQSIEWVANLAERQHAGESFNYDKLGEQGQSAKRVIGHAESLMEQYGYDKRQAANIAVKAALKGGTPEILPISVSLSAEAGVSASNETNQHTQDSNSDSREKSASEDYNNIIKVASNENWAKEHNIDQSLGEAVRTSSAVEQRAEQQLSKSQERSDQYHAAETLLRTQSASSSQDVRHIVQQDIQNQYGVSAKEAHDMIERNDPRVDTVWNARVNRKVEKLLASISVDKERIAGEAAATQLDNASDQYNQQVSNSNVSNEARVRNKAYNKMQGKTYDSVKEDMRVKNDQLKGQSYNVQHQNSRINQAITEENQQLVEAKQARVNKLEKNRIGQGDAAQIVGAITETLTTGGIFGQIGAIGGPTNPSTKKQHPEVPATGYQKVEKK